MSHSAAEPAAPNVILRALAPDEAERAVPALAALLVDAVASGASVNFMAGFAIEEAERFWRGQMSGIVAGQRILLVAEEGGAIIGCVIVSFAPQPNQPHRADVNKMLVHSTRRRLGLGRRLLGAAEDAARSAGKTLLVLDTESDAAGHKLYAAAGWVEVGTIPGYALSPDGRPSGATIFYKSIAEVRAKRAELAIRPAAEADLPAILAIYNDAVVNTTAIWNDDVVDLANRAAWLAARQAQGYPVLVAVEGERVLGYGTYGDFRPHQGYRLTVENSIYVAAEARGKGAGAALLAAVVDHAANAGKHVMIAAITAGNEVSVRLHARQGFVETGRLGEVGVKFGRYLDLILMERRLTPSSTPPA